jgi:TrmH family RNA methyltransferase
MEYLSKAEQARIRVLDKKKEREEQGRFIAEGLKICSELLSSSFNIQYAVISDDASSSALSLAEEYEQAGIEVCKAGTTAFSRMSDAVNPQDMFAIVETSESSINTPQTFLALENINDPGNLGTILRSADWFGMKHVILGGNCADPFSPKAIRASMGSILRVQVHIEKSLSKFLHEWKARFQDGELFGLIVESNASLKDINHLPNAWGLIMGSESHGLSPETSSCITKPIRIDGTGSAESLNVGIATGIALYHCMNVQSGQ